MCGRFVQKKPVSELESFFDIKGPLPNFEPRYNVAPTQEAAVVMMGPLNRQIAIKKWGLIPAWSKEGKAEFATFNARAESVREKPTYRQAFLQRRCIVPADGFYEWTGPKGAKIPHLFERVDGAPLALAGLHETWRSKDGKEQVQSFTIVVTAANRWMSFYHERMPVILEAADFDTWLKGTADEAAPLMRPAPEDALKERVVSTLVNNVKNEGPELVA
jgi:putative SOS response-associated peptidase YedK